MDAIIIKKDQVILSLSKEEITIARNSVDVICIEIEDCEFQTRLGVYLEDARIILKALNSIIKKMEQ